MTLTTAAPGIVLATHGITTHGAQSALAAFTDRVQAIFPGHTIHWAFTARHKGGSQPSGTAAPADLAATLSFFAAAGVAQIAVQPLHLVAGQEHEGLHTAIAAWCATHPGITVGVGAPLLADAADAEEVMAAMLTLPPVLATDEAAVWVGHGSKAPGYAQLAGLAAASGKPLLMGCLSSRPGVDDVLAAMAATGKTKACLRPFFALPGHHATSDVGGTGEDSWKSRMERAGVPCRMEAKGLVEYEAFGSMWLARLHTALAAFAA